jgi:hypothetical protein
MVLCHYCSAQKCVGAVSVCCLWLFLALLAGAFLHSFKVLDEYGNGFISSVIAGINAVAAYQPPSDKPFWAPRVTLLSLVWPRSLAELVRLECEQMASALSDQGIMLVAAAGESCSDNVVPSDR